jgi:halimadienyl-diphosphate synthase
MQNTILQSTEFIRQPKEGITSGVAYDTAWTARVVNRSGKSLFPECIRWLIENQKPDGSWGGQILNYHDRVLSTLSAIVALKEVGKGRYDNCIQEGEKYIWENVRNLEQDHCRLIGSELLFPSLMQQAESQDLNLPYHIKIYQKEYQEKLSKVDESLWYSPSTPLVFSFEFLGDNVDITNLPNVQLPNGSVAASPAATAFFLKHIKDPKAFSYLKEILSITGNGSIMTVYPIEVFEYAWSIYNFMLAGLYFERYREICDYLLSWMRPSGYGWSAELPIHDVDDTAMVLKVLHDMNYPIDIGIVEKYNKGNYYATYNCEIGCSTSINIHVLDLIRSCLTFPNRNEMIEKLTCFLKKEMQTSGYWMDKWHISPYYPTSHAVFALCDIDQSLVEKAISWILKSQNENGMWGENGGTLEETAYAIQALIYYHQKVSHIDISGVLRALPHINYAILTPSNTFPGLWIGKVQYAPVNVVWSTISSAKVMLQFAKRMGVHL